MSARRGRLPERHLVGGRWITAQDVARQFGVTPKAVHLWRHRHPRTDGRPALMEEAVRHFTCRAAGIPDEKETRGRRPERHLVGGRRVTVREVAEAHRWPVYRLRLALGRYRCTLAEAVERLERLDARRAEKRILDIIRGDNGP